MSKILVVDSTREFTDGTVATYARSAQEGLDWLRIREWAEVYINVDGGPTDDNLVVVDYLCNISDQGNRHPGAVGIQVHSRIPGGPTEVVASLERCGYHPVVINTKRFELMTWWEVTYAKLAEWFYWLFPTKENNAAQSN